MPAELSPSLALELVSGPALSPVARPLARQGDHVYAALWPYVRRPETKQPVKRQLVFVRDDGLLHLPEASEPAGPARLPSGLPADLPVPEDRLWSAGAVQLYLAGRRPEPAAVFQRLTRVLAHFVDFASSQHSLAEPSVMAEFFAAYILSTWLAPAFPVLPLLWITGDRGSGKSRLLGLLAQLAYLGILLPALPPFEPLCALAGLGATLALDDAYALTAQETGAPSWPRRGPYAVLIAGRQRGPLLPVARLGPRDPPRQLDVYGPRLFASTRPPHSALSGYCLAVPLFRSLDTDLMARDPLDPAAWHALGPDSPRALIDDLWALALSRLSDLPPHVSLAAHAASSPALALPPTPPNPHAIPCISAAGDTPTPAPPLLGSGLQPWHALLAIASWLSGLGAQGVPGLFDRLAPLALPAQSGASAPASTDSAALALQGIYIFAVVLLGQLAKAYNRAIATGRLTSAHSNDSHDGKHDGNHDGNRQEIGQNDGHDSNDSRIDLADVDDLGDTSPSGLYTLSPGVGARPSPVSTVPLPPDLWPTVYTFTVGALLECIQALAAEQGWDLPRPGLTDVHVGRLLSQLGLRHQRTAHRRTWSVTPAQLVRLSRAYNLPIPQALAPALYHVIEKQASKK